MAFSLFPGINDSRNFSPFAPQTPDLNLLMNGVLSSDPAEAQLALQQLACLEMAEILMALRQLDPAMFQQIAQMVANVNQQNATSNGMAFDPESGAVSGAPGAISPMRQRQRLQAPELPRAPSERNTPTGQLRGSTDGTYVPGAKVYKPGSPEAVGLFREAAKLAGVPESWASSQALHNILARESGGVVGRPNYTYGARANDRSQWEAIHNELKAGRITARSSATGLGQLLLSNVDRYYPAGRAGIGDPVQEAAGMLRYIKARYGTPENAWARYNTVHEGY